MQGNCSSIPPVVTGICDPNKSQAQHHNSFKLKLCNFNLVKCLIWKKKKNEWIVEANG